MSAFCDLALALGLTLSGACQPAAAPTDPLPADDPAAWTHRPPAPKEEPKPPPVMPPVIIQKEVIREVHVPVPAPVAAPAAAPPPAPDPLELAVRASYLHRSAGPAPPSVTLASLPDGSTAAGMPLPLGMSSGSGAGRGAGGTEYEEEGRTSTKPVDNSRVLTNDRYVCGTLESATNTQLDGSSGGTVVIQVSRDTFGYHGRNILVPKGSRLVCGYKSLEKVGSSRSPFRCSRILLGESRAEIFGLKANVIDVQGHLGASGDVDHRFGERYGTAFILAGVSAAVRAATANTSATSSSSTASATGSSSTFSGNGGALSEGGAELSQRLGEITAATLEQTINLLPILRTFQGQRVCIRPDTDWYIAEMEL
ncbi:Type IV secretion system protein ptlG [Magnetospirillum gryphiswaldense MSR-1 v2]|uniref:Type IV secretion system protein ptlG n=2 Tax=Magnetospirillum gryphiswaldense TaxID=55518 RepID=V6F2P2_MAGGM|nr:TrbI/VirB10 family protein [Magnetospirillum gryphiswaldense]CAM78256.1 Bacterial conjugation TrbI-like protein [Magnetospirillum gryphiswaldense MSR-1]CDK99667.1 Type IV secretion system protein ptlG [Magnetospirillum gryphiswaldense MSR-1 v2]